MIQCPKCGLPMVRQHQWPGLLICSDYQNPINAKPPYQYKCRGMIVTKDDCAAFDKEIAKIIEERN